MLAYIVTIAQMRRYAPGGFDLSKYEGTPDDEEFLIIADKPLDFLPRDCKAKIQLETKDGQIIDAGPIDFDELGR